MYVYAIYVNLFLRNYCFLLFTSMRVSHNDLKRVIGGESCVCLCIYVRRLETWHIARIHISTSDWEYSIIILPLCLASTYVDLRVRRGPSGQTRTFGSYEDLRVNTGLSGPIEESALLDLTNSQLPDLKQEYMQVCYCTTINLQMLLMRIVLLI